MTPGVATESITLYFLLKKTWQSWIASASTTIYRNAIKKFFSFAWWQIVQKLCLPCHHLPSHTPLNGLGPTLERHLTGNIDVFATRAAYITNAYWKYTNIIRLIGLQQKCTHTSFVIMQNALQKYKIIRKNASLCFTYDSLVEYISTKKTNNTAKMCTCPSYTMLMIP